jgi:hypothetical protein
MAFERSRYLLATAREKVFDRIYSEGRKDLSRHSTEKPTFPKFVEVEPRSLPPNGSAEAWNPLDVDLRKYHASVVAMPC